MNVNMIMNTNMTMNIEDEHKREREREYEHEDEHEQLREDDVGFFSGSAAEAAGLGILPLWLLGLPLGRERCFGGYWRCFPAWF